MKINVAKSNIQIASKKHYQIDGKWVTKPTKTEILLCVCGRKYIKTRPKQDACIKCFTR